MSIIHCIGDSNTSLFSGIDKPSNINSRDYVAKVYPELMEQILPNFRVYQFWDLAFNMSRNIPEIFEIFRKFTSPGDSVLFSYGKRDCRGQIKKQIEAQRKSEDAVIEEIVNHYMKILVFIKETIFQESKLNKFMVYNAVPQGVITKETVHLFYGTQEERMQYTIKFNNRLKEACEPHGMLFIETSSFMLDENNLPFKRIFTDDGNHLNQTMLQPTIDEIYKKMNFTV
jgi:hypothetical protein